jgi:hypothetical protein
MMKWTFLLMNAVATLTYCQMEIRTDVLGPIGGEILGVAEDNVEGPLPDVDVDFDGDVQDK